MRIIGITGPTGAGKTTALHALADLGAAVIDCDGVYHDLTENSAPMLDELRRRFGDGIFDSDGALQRKVLGTIVFGDEGSLADLNAITHRYVNDEVDRRLDQARGEGRPAAAVDAIALLDSDLRDKCHCTVAVTAPDEVRVRRIMARDGIGEEDARLRGNGTIPAVWSARLRLAAQKPVEYFEHNSDYTLRNDGEDPAEFYRRARALFEPLIFQGGI